MVMTSKNGIKYTSKKALKMDGKIIGYHLYNNYKGLLGVDRFVGYLWRTKTGNAPILN